MSRSIRIVVSLTVAALAAWLLYQRVGTGGGREPARLDSGISVEGERGRIDPHGAPEVAPVAPLSIEARLVAATPEDLRIEVELGAAAMLDSVVVRASRFDVPGAIEPAWSEVVWTGRVDAAASVRFESRVPLAGPAPNRVQLSAHATGPGGARLSTTAIVRPESEAP